MLKNPLQLTHMCFFPGSCQDAHGRLMVEQVVRPQLVAPAILLPNAAGDNLKAHRAAPPPPQGTREQRRGDWGGANCARPPSTTSTQPGPEPINPECTVREHNGQYCCPAPLSYMRVVTSRSVRLRTLLR